MILLIVYIELSRFAASGYWRRLPASAVVFAIALSGLPLSPFVRKTLFMLYELDLSFEQKMPPVFDHLESQLDASGAGWLIGEDFTYADIAIGAHMSNLVLAQIEPDRRRWSTLGAWFERVQSRSAFQQLCTDARNFRP